MNSLKKSFPLLVLLPQLLLGAASLKALAQQPQQPQGNVRKEHLEYCIKQLTVQVGQLEAIEGVKKQTNLTPMQKLEAINQILSPQQKQQLRQCMQQPMPPQQQPMSPQ
ncbi:hypothetical protein [Chroococcus sp. FPU101]|uniref:hypothetical protein n=1 Tax=Chroococcus sp. FPU101 TaxID=1974212 RepID=UPI001A8EAAF7|nr:hypothetical protein [Chroococcus sp. FPU101]GFE68544.1 hypothetical protein CFPU101_11540 [Chroococcus sp. FPU101]